MAEENKLNTENVEETKEIHLNENISRVIVSMVYFNSLIRDTLEYTLIKPEYNLDFYNYKKRGIINEPKIGSPLQNFMKQNGEKGEKLLEKIQDFTDLIYGDDSTILKVTESGLRVDHVQHLAILEAVITLHEEMNQVILAHVGFAKKENRYEETIQHLLAIDERFYRAVSYFSLANELFKQFDEFNKIMKENKGQKTAASNYVEKDLAKIVGLFEFEKKYATAIDTQYMELSDSMTKMIEMMTGKRGLGQGQTFKTVFEANANLIRNYIAVAEREWRAIYGPCVKDVADHFSKNGENKEA